jgi:fructose/tagatose bisphosphate aldolase
LNHVRYETASVLRLHAPKSLRFRFIQRLQRGYYSVMYDGAHFPLEQNITEAAYIAKIAHAMGAAVEAPI